MQVRVVRSPGTPWWKVEVLGPIETSTLDPDLGGGIEALVHQTGFFDLPEFMPSQEPATWISVAWEYRTAGGPATTILVTKRHWVEATRLPTGSFDELAGLLEQAGATWRDEDLR